MIPGVFLHSVKHCMLAHVLLLTVTNLSSEGEA